MDNDNNNNISNLVQPQGEEKEKKKIPLPPPIQLVEIIKHVFKNNQSNIINEDTLLSLYSIFGKPLFASLDILDNNLISLYVFLPSKRYFYVIEGRKGAKYMCLLKGDYCSCPSFNYSVLLKSDSLYCKHQVSAFLAEILSNAPCLEFDDSEYITKVLEIEALSFKTPSQKTQRNVNKAM